MLNFCPGNYLKSQFLLTKVISQSVSQQAINLGFYYRDRFCRIRIIKLATYVQPLNKRLDSKNCSVGLKTTTRIKKKDQIERVSKSFSIQLAFMYLCSLNFKKRNIQHFKQAILTSIKLTTTFLKRLPQQIMSFSSASNMIQKFFGRSFLSL